MNLRTIASSRARSARLAFSRSPVMGRRPSLHLAVVAAGVLMLNVGGASAPAAQAELESVSVARQLGIAPADTQVPVAGAEKIAPLEQLAASRSERKAQQTAAADAQAQAEEAARAAAEEAARVAAEQAAAAEAARKAEEEAAAAGPGEGTAAAVAHSGSYKDYAMSKLGGSGSQFSCLQSLWGKESGWNPNAQNPSSTAYGIAQFLNSTWAGTGIAKTSDGFRQIDAGLIYIKRSYGSPCGAWAHSRSAGWY